MDKGFIYGLLIATSHSILLDLNNIFLFIGIPSEVKYLLLLRYLITEKVSDMAMKEELITITYNITFLITITQGKTYGILVNSGKKCLF